MSGLKKFVIFLLVLVIAFPAVAFGYVYTRLKSIQDTDTDFNTLVSNNYKSDNGIINILLMGTDGRPGDTQERSDSMMILTVDNKHKKLKLTSLGRDTYVFIEGHGKQKLTHAYAYGKAPLLIDTIERNFNLDIQNYAQVNFFSFMDIIDVLGGVEVNVTKGEIHETNKFINETYRWDKKSHGKPIKYIKRTGMQKLNGYQALSFARIRKNDGTMERDSRQRQVIQSMLKELDHLSILKYNDLMESILPYVKTNMSPTTILGLAKDVLSMPNKNLISIQFPFHPENETRLQESGYVIPFGEYEVDLLHGFIFNDIMPTKKLIDEKTQEFFNNGGSIQSEFYNVRDYKEGYEHESTNRVYNPNSSTGSSSTNRTGTSKNYNNEVNKYNGRKNRQGRINRNRNKINNGGNTVVTPSIKTPDNGDGDGGYTPVAPPGSGSSSGSSGGSSGSESSGSYNYSPPSSGSSTGE